MNRIDVAIATTRAIIEAKEYSPEKIEAMSRSLDIELEEYAHYQEAKALAQAAGRITHDEALTLYAALGRGPSSFNARHLAVKAAVIRSIAEIMGVHREKV